VIPSLDEITAEACAMKTAVPGELLPSLLHYTSHAEAVVVPVSDIALQSGRSPADVARQVLPQICARFGPAEQIVIVDDDGDDLLILHATPIAAVARHVGYLYDAGELVWGDAVDRAVDRAVVPPPGGLGAAVLACFHEPGHLN
jgi:hypothetical protein